MPRKYREAAEPGAGRGHQSVNAMRPKHKTRQHTQSPPTHAMGREHQARGTEGSRTHYFPDRGTHWSKGQQRFWFKNETRPRGTRQSERATRVHHRNQTQSHTKRAENKAQGGKKDHRPKRGANVVKGAERGTRAAGWSTKSALFSC